MAKRTYSKWVFWLRWVVATAVGESVSFVLSRELSSLLRSTGEPQLLEVSITLIIFGVVVSTAQSLVRGWHAPKSWWILLTTLSSFVGGWIWIVLEVITLPGDTMPTYRNDIPTNNHQEVNVIINTLKTLIPFSVYGAIFGSFQCRLISPNRKAVWWILATIVGFTISGIILLRYPPKNPPSLLAVIWAVNGVIQATTLVWLSRTSRLSRDL